MAIKEYFRQKMYEERGEGGGLGEATSIWCFVILQSKLKYIHFMSQMWFAL